MKKRIEARSTKTSLHQAKTIIFFIGHIK